MVPWLYRSPAQIEFDRKPTLTDDAELVRMMRANGDHEIVDLFPGAKPRAVGVPDGWKLVPIKATAEMLRRARSAPVPAVMVDSLSARLDLDTGAKWDAMIAAAPEVEA